MKRLIYTATLALFGTILLTILVIAQSGAGLDIRRRVVAGLGGASIGSGRMQVSITPAKPAAGIQTSPQFDLSRSVIAGGGGTSSAGKFQIDGTIGQAAVGTQMSNGQFSQTGGIWQPESGPTSSPSPNPSPSPSPAPSSTPMTIQFSAARSVISGRPPA